MKPNSTGLVMRFHFIRTNNPIYRTRWVQSIKPLFNRFHVKINFLVTKSALNPIYINMKNPWFWITGVATMAIGAVSTGLLFTHTFSPQKQSPRVESVNLDEDPWEVFILTEGRHITDQIDQLGMKIDRLEKNLTDVNSRIEPRLKNSTEMRKARQQLNSMCTYLEQLKDRRQRMYLRWNLGRVAHFSGDRLAEENEEEEKNSEPGSVLEPETTPSEPRLNEEISEQYRPPIQKLIEIQNEVIQKKIEEQGFFQQLFGQNFDESQMARYTFIYRYFEAQGVQNIDTLFRLVRCYSSFIVGGQRFNANLQMMPQIHRFCSTSPNSQSLEKIQKAIAKDVQANKVLLGRRFEMEVTRYSQVRLWKVFDYSKSAGATDEQARRVVIQLKNFINNGAVPHNE